METAGRASKKRKEKMAETGGRASTKRKEKNGDEWVVGRVCIYVCLKLCSSVAQTGGGQKCADGKEAR